MIAGMMRFLKRYDLPDKLLPVITSCNGKGNRLLYDIYFIFFIPSKEIKFEKWQQWQEWQRQAWLECTESKKRTIILLVRQKPSMVNPGVNR
jgi:hypothetical protein